MEEYVSNNEGKGGPLKYNNSAKEAITVIEKYDIGWLCGLCYYYDENGNQITREIFVENFLPKNNEWELTHPLYATFETIIDQSNKPQVLIMRPKLATTDKGRRIAAGLPFGTRILTLLGVKNRNLWKKDAA